MAMLIEQRPVEELIPYPGNPRDNDAAVAAVAESIERFGFRQPIVVDKDSVVVVGHTRLKAALKLGIERVPVHVADLTEEQARAYRLADNRTGAIATWDAGLLQSELEALQQLGLDIESLASLGFDDRELAALSNPGNVGETDPDEVPEPPDDPVTQPGDLWILGEHRLLCGDSSSSADVDCLCDGHTVQMLNTDPPYNVDAQSRSKNAIASGKSSFKGDGTGGTSSSKMRAKDRSIANDSMTDEDFAANLRAWFGNATRVLDPGRGCYIWGGYSNLSVFPKAMADTGLYFSQAIIWQKLHPVIGRKDFMSDFELAFYGWREGQAHQFFGPNNATDHWAIKKVNPQSMCHLTEKPVELAARAIGYSSRPGERVLDLFGGSGSTLIACEQLGRKALLMEIDPAYCDVIVQRWEGFTSKKAELASDNTPAAAEAS